MGHITYVKHFLKTNYFKEPKVLNINDDIVNCFYDIKDKDFFDNSSLEIENEIYMKLKYLNKNQEECFKLSKVLVNKITRENNKSISNAYFSSVSNAEIKSKNIIDKNKIDFKKHFEKIIDNIECDVSLKTILKERMVNYKPENLPFLYFNEKENKQIWWIPNFMNDEDIFLDFEKEIPIFQDKFEKEIFNGNNKNKFLVVSSEEISSFNIMFESTLRLHIDIPKNFVFPKNLTNQNILENSSIGIKFNENNGNMDSYLNFVIPEFFSLNEEQTTKFLKLNNSEMTLNGIKGILLQYRCSSKDNAIKDVSKLFIDGSVKNISFNATFVSNEVSLIDEILKQNNEENTFTLDHFIQDAKKDKSSNYISNLNISYDKKDKFLLPLTYNYYKLADNEINNKILENKNNDVLFLNLNENGKILIPKYKGVLYNNDAFVDNTKLCFADYNVDTLFSEGKYLVTKGRSFKRDEYYPNMFSDIFSIYELPQEIKFKNNNNDLKYNLKKYYKNLGRHNELLLIHNYNNDIILINKNTKESKIIDNSEEIIFANKNMLHNLNLKSNLEFCDIYFTENKTLYFLSKEKLENNTNNELIKEYEYIEKEKINDNYSLEIKIPVTKTDKDIKYTNKIKYIHLNYTLNLKNNELNYDKKININNNEYDFLTVNYLIKEDFLQNTSDIYDYIKEIKLHNLTLKNEEAVNFYLEVNFKEYPSFDIKSKVYDNTTTLNVSNRMEKINFVIAKNINYDFNFSNYINNNTKMDNLLKMYKNNKLLGMIDNENKKTKIYYSNDKIFLTSMKNQTIDVIDNFNYNFTLKNKDSLINKKCDDIIYNNEKNDEISLIFDNKNYFTGLFNLTKEKNLKNSFKNLGTSL